MASPDFPFIDFPAPDSLTVRLEPVLGAIRLSIYWGGDPMHTLGTRDLFRWDGKWVSRDLVVQSDEAIMREIRKNLVWHDLSGRTIDDLFSSGVLYSVIVNAARHHLVLTVMGT